VNQRAIALVREGMKAAELSRQELAKRSGVPDGTIAGLFAGTKPIYVDQLVAFAVALKADQAAWMRELERVEKAKRQSATVTELPTNPKPPNDAQTRMAARGSQKNPRADG